MGKNGNLIQLYKLAKLYDSSEHRENHISDTLDYFLSLPREDQLVVMDHYFVEVRNSELLKMLNMELTNEETIVKRHDQNVKTWLFKAMIAFGLFVLFFFTIAMQSLEKIAGSASSFEAIIKFLRMVMQI